MDTTWVSDDGYISTYQYLNRHDILYVLIPVVMLFYVSLLRLY